MLFSLRVQFLLGWGCNIAAVEGRYGGQLTVALRAHWADNRRVFYVYNDGRDFHAMPCRAADVKPSVVGRSEQLRGPGLPAGPLGAIW